MIAFSTSALLEPQSPNSSMPASTAVDISVRRTAKSEVSDTDRYLSALRRVADDEACFFSAMGDLAAGRVAA